MRVSQDGKFLIDVIHKTIYIYNLMTRSLVRRLKHHQEITAFTLIRDSLAFGDSQGKIRTVYHLFRFDPHVSLKDNEMVPESKVNHWHSQPVRALNFSEDGNFLISGGKEGVLVLWHQSGNKHDFIPRLGATIVF